MTVRKWLSKINFPLVIREKKINNVLSLQLQVHHRQIYSNKNLGTVISMSDLLET